MQARIETRRIPSTFVAFVFITLMALVIGMAVGYAIKPPSVISGPVHTVVLPASLASSSDAACQFVDKHKAC